IRDFHVTGVQTCALPILGLTADDPIKVSYGHPFPGEPTGTTERDTLKLDWSHGHNMAVVNGIGRIGYMQGGRSALWQDKDMADEIGRASGGDRVRGEGVA